MRSPGHPEYTANHSIATSSAIRNRICRLRLLQILSGKGTPNTLTSVTVTVVCSCVTAVSYIHGLLILIATMTI
jgi:hypothetical protein